MELMDNVITSWRQGCSLTLNKAMKKKPEVVATQDGFTFSIGTPVQMNAAKYDGNHMVGYVIGINQTPSDVMYAVRFSDFQVQKLYGFELSDAEISIEEDEDE